MSATFENGDVAALSEFSAEGVIDHNLPPGSRGGRAGLADAVRFYASAFPDLAVGVDEAVAHDRSVPSHSRGARVTASAAGARSPRRPSRQSSNGSRRSRNVGSPKNSAYVSCSVSNSSDFSPSRASASLVKYAAST